MRIAQVAPLQESVPPKYYGGTERVVSYLTEGLVERGHDVTLFASGDSKTAAALVSPCAKGLRLDDSCMLPQVYEVLQLEQLRRRANAFDVIHFHTGFTHFTLCDVLDFPEITTMHGRLDIPDLRPLFEAFPRTPLVSISEAQRRPLPKLNWKQTIHHGLPEDLYSFHETTGGYLAFIGRVSPEKRVDRAIEIARRSGQCLKVAAKVDPVDREYFKREVEPRLHDSHVEFLGEIEDGEKNQFLGNARALLFPIDWPEPFGLVMIESFACGTPVIAYPRGSVPEIMKDGTSGFVVNSIDEAVEAVERIPALDRRRCRRYFENRFSLTRMLDDHLQLYRRMQNKLQSPDLMYEVDQEP